MGKASITAGEGPFAFGQSYSTEEVVASFTGNGKPDMGFWARVDCSQDGKVVYAQYADLTPPLVQSGFTFGPTPSWSGGGATCTVRLFGMSNGAFGRALASDDFEAQG